MMLKIRRLDTAGTPRRVNLGAKVPAIPSELERRNRLRAELYSSPRWRRERQAFLRLHPLCITAGCGGSSAVVDHLDGHQRHDWLATFWDKSRWQPMCTTCHAIKSRAELTAWRQAGEARGGRVESLGPLGARTAAGLRTQNFRIK